jgi:hypothetical protein
MKTMLMIFLLATSSLASADIYDRINNCENNGGGACVYDLLRELARNRGGKGTLVESNGSASAPHCSWSSSCNWDQDTKNICAQKLCEASGFKTGRFVKASNNMCTTSYTSSSLHYYNVDKQKYDHGSPSNEAKITARCR